MQKKMEEDKKEAGETENSLVISFDLQQAMPLANLTVSTTFWEKSEFTTSGYTTGKAYMYMWPEHVARRGSDETF